MMKWDGLKKVKWNWRGMSVIEENAMRDAKARKGNGRVENKDANRNEKKGR